MKRVNLYLSDPQTKKLREISRKTDLSISEHIRKALDKYIEEWEEKEKERK